MTRCLSVVWLACLTAVFGVALAADAPPAASDAERLVKQLGAGKHADREAAARALDALGAAALPALRDGANSPDPEVRRRAGELLAKLDGQAESAAALAPTKVTLKADARPLAEVVGDLAKQAGVRILLAREPADMPSRPVTVNLTGTSFWEALDAVCRAARVSLRPGTFDPTPAGEVGGGVALPPGVGNV